MSTITPRDDEAKVNVSTGYQSISVCAPVTVTPYAQTGDIVTRVCGAPTISNDVGNCPGVQNGTCAFTISQSLCIAVPIEFGAETEVGDIYVECGEATAEDICTNCGATDD
jgi:hypothetical protein